MAALLVIATLGTQAGLLAAQTPDLPDKFPIVETKVMGETGAGYIYLSNVSRTPLALIASRNAYRRYLMVLDNDGSPVFYQDIRIRASDFRSFANGTMIYHDLTYPGRVAGVGVDGPFMVLDGNGNVIDEYRMIGYPTTLHDFLLLPDGNVILFAYDERVMDLTEYGGHPAAIVVNTVLQEIDPDHNVVWEWSGWDHFEIEDTVRKAQYDNEPPEPVDFLHANGLALDLDGNIVLSSKHLDEITKINHETGDIIWRMGGRYNRNNEFTFINDPLNGFSAQHHPVILPNGNLLLFDNGTAHEPRESRAVEYELDQEARTATLVWSYSNGQYAAGMGSVQRLANGNTFIGWGSSEGVTASEVTPEGEVVFELSLPPSEISYRAYRLPFYGEIE
ncbi:MAG: aryl-sulfate sulfotransferase [Anaerolineae bacterium]|nr:aryl-sulfate sulfotransferase [Anaerolineae bacterium]